jgi:hypothetical protein
MSTVLMHETFVFHKVNPIPWEQSWCMKKFMFNDLNPIPWKQSWCTNTFVFHEVNPISWEKSGILKAFVFHEVNPIPWHGPDSWKHSFSMKYNPIPWPTCPTTTVLLHGKSCPVKTILPMKTLFRENNPNTLYTEVLRYFAAFWVKFQRWIATFFPHKKFVCYDKYFQIAHLLSRSDQKSRAAISWIF